ESHDGPASCSGVAALSPIIRHPSFVICRPSPLLGCKCNFTEVVEVGHHGVPGLERYGSGGGAGPDDVPRVRDHAATVELVGQPGHRVHRIAHHRGRHPALLDDAVDGEGRADAPDVDVGEAGRSATQDDQTTRRGVGDAVDEAVGTATVLARVDDLDAGQHKVRGPDHVDRVHARADEWGPEHEGQLDLDEWLVHPAARNLAALE